MRHFFNIITTLLIILFLFVKLHKKFFVHFPQNFRKKNCLKFFVHFSQNFLCKNYLKIFVHFSQNFRKKLFKIFCAFFTKKYHTTRPFGENGSQRSPASHSRILGFSFVYSKRKPLSKIILKPSGLQQRIAAIGCDCLS